MNLISTDYYANARIANSLQIEDEQQRWSDLDDARRQERLEALEDDRLIDESFDAFSELFNGASEQRARKMINELVKAIVSKEGLNKPISSLLCYLNNDDEDKVRDYLLK